LRIIQSENPRPLNSLAVGPNGLIAAASNTFGAPGDVELLDATAGERRHCFEAPDHTATSAVGFAPDGSYLLVGEQRLRVAVLDPASGQIVSDARTSPGQPDFALSADGRRLMVVSRLNQAGMAECFAVESGPTLRLLWLEGPRESYWFHRPAVTPDGNRVALVENPAHGGSGGRPALRVSVRDAAVGNTLATIPADIVNPIRQLAFTAGGSKLLVRTDSNKVQLFDAATGASAGELAHPGRPYVTGIAVHPKGPVACARTNGAVTFWDAEKREQLRTLDWKAGRLVSVAFSPDGAIAAAGTEDGKVVVWDVDL
jgi:hypothetical protein